MINNTSEWWGICRAVLILRTLYGKVDMGNDNMNSVEVTINMLII